MLKKGLAALHLYVHYVPNRQGLVKIRYISIHHLIIVWKATPVPFLYNIRLMQRAGSGSCMKEAFQFPK